MSEEMNMLYEKMNKRWEESGEDIFVFLGAENYRRCCKSGDIGFVRKVLEKRFRPDKLMDYFYLVGKYMDIDEFLREAIGYYHPRSDLVDYAKNVLGESVFEKIGVLLSVVHDGFYKYSDKKFESFDELICFICDAKQVVDYFKQRIGLVEKFFVEGKILDLSQSDVEQLKEMVDKYVVLKNYVKDGIEDVFRDIGGKGVEKLSAEKRWIIDLAKHVGVKLYIELDARISINGLVKKIIEIVDEIGWNSYRGLVILDGVDVRVSVYSHDMVMGVERVLKNVLTKPVYAQFDLESWLWIGHADEMEFYGDMVVFLKNGEVVKYLKVFPMDYSGLKKGVLGKFSSYAEFELSDIGLLSKYFVGDTVFFAERNDELWLFVEGFDGVFRKRIDKMGKFKGVGDNFAVAFGAEYLKSMVKLFKGREVKLMFAEEMPLVIDDGDVIGAVAPRVSSLSDEILFSEETEGRKIVFGDDFVDAVRLIGRDVRYMVISPERVGYLISFYGVVSFTLKEADIDKRVYFYMDKMDYRMWKTFGVDEQDVFLGFNGMLYLNGVEIGSAVVRDDFVDVLLNFADELRPVKWFEVKDLKKFGGRYIYSEEDGVKLVGESEGDVEKIYERINDFYRSERISKKTIMNLISYLKARNVDKVGFVFVENKEISGCCGFVWENDGRKEYILFKAEWW